jgi:glycosyltransferase involved in cell wall biosynthesis
MQGSDGAPPARRPRVAIAMPGGYDFGGIGRMMLYATAAWRDSEAPVEWWLVDARGNGSLLWMPLMTARAISGLVLRRPDLLHLNVANRGSTLRKLVLSRAAALLGIPTVVHLHFGDYADDLARRRPFIQRQVEAMFRRARRVIVLGGQDRQTVIEHLGVAPERIEVLHNAVPDPGPPADRRRRDGPVRLLFLGRFDDPAKGLADLLAALAGPGLAAGNWHLTVAGRGEVAAFREQLQQPALAERVTFAGWQPHARVYELCAEADIFVLPSYSEGQAMSLLEAMAHGLAIVATPVGSHTEAVRDGAEALLVAPGDVGQLALALARLVAEPALRQRLGTAARRKYCDNFDAVQYSKSLLKIYDRAMVDEIA